MITFDESIVFLIKWAQVYSSEIDLDAEKRVLDEIHYRITLGNAVGRKKGISIQTYLLSLNVLSMYCLNRNEIQRALNICDVFSKLCSIYKPKIQKFVYYDHIDTWSEALFRRGDFIGCQSLIKQCLPDIGDDHVRCSMLIRLGNAESCSNYPNLVINSLCEALGIAEKLKDPKLIARCYIEIAKLLGNKYSWLAISLLCDAETIDERFRDNISFSEIMMHKAVAFYSIYVKSDYNESYEVYLKKAKQVLSIVRSEDIVQDSTQALYNSYYGQIYADIDKLKESLSFYEKAGSIKDVIRLCDHIIVASDRNKDYENGLKIIPKYLQYEKMAPDSISKKVKIQRILEIEKDFKCKISSQKI
jgi:hypothetical protein